MDVVKFLREKGMLLEDKETFKITYEDGTEIVLNDILEEFAEIRGKNGAESHLRLAAEFENFKRRSIKEKQEIKSKVKYETLSSFLNILDDLELARNNIKEDSSKKGIDIIFNKINTFMQEQGIQEIDTSGKFDPNLHEAITMTDSDKEPGYIVETVMKGYIIDDKIVRYPKVVVSE